MDLSDRGDHLRDRRNNGAEDVARVHAGRALTGYFPAYAISFVFLALAVKVIPISVAYAVWSGVGTALIATIGILWFREPVSAAKLVFLGIIVIGVVGLQLSGNTENPS